MCHLPRGDHKEQAATLTHSSKRNMVAGQRNQSRRPVAFKKPTSPRFEKAASQSQATGQFGEPPQPPLRAASLVLQHKLHKICLETSLGFTV